MSATRDLEIVVNVYGDAQSVDKKAFGNIVWATEAVEAGFTELKRTYASNSEMQQDADLSAATKTAGGIYYSQPRANRPKELTVAKVTYATLSADLDTLAAAFPEFYGIACADRTDASQQSLATWTAANARLGSIQSSTAAIAAGTAGNLFETLAGLSNGRAFGSYHETDTEYCDLAWLAQILGPDPDETASVAYDKQLVGVNAQTITTTEKSTIDGYPGNVYLTLRGRPVTGVGKLFNGDWVDELITADWVEDRLGGELAQLRIDQSQSNSKIPYDNVGLGWIDGKIRKVWQNGVNAGHLLGGDNNLIVDVPDISAVDPVDIAARQTTVSATMVSAGAQKEITINVGIVNGALA